MNRSTGQNTAGRALLEVLIAVLLTLVLIFITLVFFLTIIFIPLPLAYVFSRRPVGYGILATALLFGLCYLSVGLTLAIFLLAFLLPSALVFRKRPPFFESVAYSSGGYLVGLFAILGVCYLVFHTDLLTATINLLQSNLAEQQGLTYLLYAAFSGTPLTEISVSASGALSYVMEILTQSLETSLPTLCISMVLLGGLIGFLLLRFVLKKTGGSVLAVPPFRQMSMPKNFTWYAILAYILVLLVELIFNIDLAVVRDILLGCFVLILTVQGLAFLDFFLSIRMKTRALEILIEVACVLFLSTMLVFLGIFDQVFRLRQAPPDNN